MGNIKQKWKKVPSKRVKNIPANAMNEVNLVTTSWHKCFQLNSVLSPWITTVTLRLSAVDGRTSTLILNSRFGAVHPQLLRQSQLKLRTCRKLWSGLRGPVSPTEWFFQCADLLFVPELQLRANHSLQTPDPFNSLSYTNTTTSASSRHYLSSAGLICEQTDSR